MKRFRGFHERPYDQALLRDVDWYTLAPCYVELISLWLTQKHLNIEGVLGKRYSTDVFPRLVRYKGDLYVEDGHHRLVALAQRNVSIASVRVFTLDG